MTTRKLLSRVVLVAVTLGALSVALAAAPIDEPGVAAFKWAHTREPGELSSYLEDAVLRSLPVEYRSALLSTIPHGEAESAFWRRAFAIVRERNLSREQVEALDRAIARSTPAAFGRSAESKAEMRAIVSDLETVFGRAGVADIMYRSDSRRAGALGLPLRERLAYRWRILSSRVAAATGLRAVRDARCNCNNVSDCGTGSWNCVDDSGCSPDNPPSGDCGSGTSCQRYCVPVGEQR